MENDHADSLCRFDQPDLAFKPRSGCRSGPSRFRLARDFRQGAGHLARADDDADAGCVAVFSTGAGLAFMAGPTGGYLAGFLLAALLAGYAFERGYARNILGALAVFIVADSVIIGLGFAWLSVLFGTEKALAVGVLPFLLPEALKIALAVASVPVAQAFYARKSRAE